METRFCPPRQISPVAGFRALHFLHQETIANLQAARIAQLAPNASLQLQAKPYTALLAGPLSPGLTFLLREFDRYLEAMVSEVGYGVTGGGQLSFVREITQECVLTTVRSAGRWYAAWLAKGATEDVDWIAYLIVGLRKMIHRRVPRTRLLTARDPGDGRRMEFSHIGYSARPCFAENQTRRLWQAIYKLPAFEQRCFRLHAGLFPAEYRAWSVDETATILGTDQETVEQALQSARSALVKTMMLPLKDLNHTPLFCYPGN